MSLTRSEIKSVLKYGKFYYPATSHYNKIIIKVYCDRCYKSNLKASIGFEKKDLCLECVNEIINNEKSKSSLSIFSKKNNVKHC